MTSWTTPRTWATNDVITATMMNTHLRDELNHLHENHGAVLAMHAALNHTATGAWELVQWDTEDRDSDAIASITTDDFVIPAALAGDWLIFYQVSFSANATGRRETRIKKNETYTGKAPNGVGTVIGRFTNEGMVGGQVHSEALTIMPTLAASDRITLEAWQNSGANLAYAVNGENDSFLAGKFVGV